MTYKFNLILALLITMTSVYAQHDHALCGVSYEDQTEMIKFIEEYNKGLHRVNYRTGERYIPIKYHIVGKNNGEGMVSPIEVLKQFEKSRKTFKPFGFDLYIHNLEINTIKNSSIAEFPRNNSYTIARKKDNAFNLFITKEIEKENVAGYYSTIYDFIVLSKRYINDDNTADHELGHMLGLPHTFYGWESNPYNKETYGDTVKIKIAPDGTKEVELVDRSNCDTAADKICDTPVDYNFGINSPSCNFNLTVYDSNGDKITPMKNNMMSYFSGCSEFKFTQGQADIMKSNYTLLSRNGNDRSFLHTDYIPSGDSMITKLELIEPKNSSTSTYYDYVLLDWNDIPNAEKYQLEINIINTSNGSKTTLYPVTLDSQYELTSSLEQGNYVLWKVMPFNENYANIEPQKGSFFAGKGTVSTNDIAKFLSKLVISPNPVIEDQNINISFDSEESLNVNITLTDMQGKLVNTSSRQIYQGRNTIALDRQGLVSGVYFIKLESSKGSLIKKVILQ